MKPPRLEDGSAGRAPTLRRISRHLTYNWGKSRKTSVRVTEFSSAVQRRTRFIWSTWPSRAMASTGLLLPAALGFRVRRRGQPSVILGICRVAVLVGSPHKRTLSQSSRSGFWCGGQTAARPDPRVSACYLRTKDISSEAKTLGSWHLYPPDMGAASRHPHGARFSSGDGWAAYVAGLRSWRIDQSSYSGGGPEYPSFEQPSSWPGRC